jgi:hypothetical protein
MHSPSLDHTVSRLAHKTVAHTLHKISLHRISRGIQRQLFSQWRSYGLQRDVTVPFQAPPCRIPVVIRQLHTSDVPHILPLDTSHLPHHEQREIEVRRALLAADIPTCFVAIDLINNAPCFLQWLMGPDQNDRIRKFFKGRFPRLAADEALLENAYTPPHYRSLAIMPHAMALIAARARAQGARQVLTFVHHDNIPSLKGCVRAGFRPGLLRVDTRILCGLIRSRKFSQLPRDISFPFEQTAQKTPIQSEPV